MPVLNEVLAPISVVLGQKSGRESMDSRSVEIVCTACGAETFVKRIPKYDGFVKVGERVVCASCGHEFGSEEEVPFKEKKAITVFSANDTSKKIAIFSNDEKERNCRHCKHYVVNPFTQRCSLHQKEVEATDICDDFGAMRKKKNDGDD